jgi:hypothetical protein
MTLKLWLMGLVLLLMSVGIGIVALYDLEPLHNGKFLSTWMLQYDSPARPAAHAKADEAIRSIGPRALPYILPNLFPFSSKPPTWKLRMNGWLGKLRLPQLHIAGPEQAQSRAADAFAALRSRPDISAALIEMYCQAKRQGSVSKQLEALNGLQYLGTAAAAAVPLLLAESKSSNAEIRREAFRALGRIRSDPDRVVKELIEGLQDPDRLVRISATRALADFGQEAASAVTPLMELLRQEELAINTVLDSAEVRVARGLIKLALEQITERTVDSPARQ